MPRDLHGWDFRQGHPRVLQYERLGHELGGIEGVYSHVTQPMRDRLITELQQRWTTLTTRPGSAR